MMKIRSLPLVTLLAVLLLAPLAGASAQGNPKSSATSKELLPPPKRWAAQMGPAEFTLAWGRVAAASAYEVLVRTTNGEFIPLGRVTASGSRFVVPFARLSGLGILLEKVEFAVRAIEGSRIGALGLFNPVSAAKQSAAKALVAPTNLTATESAPGVVTVTWDEVPGATAYAIGRAMGASGYQRFCDVCPTGGTLVDTVPATGTRYSYRVVALWPMGSSRPAMTSPVEVTGLAAVAGGTAQDSSKSRVTSTADVDPKRLVDGITVTPRAGGGGLSLPAGSGGGGGALGAGFRMLVNVAIQVAERVIDNSGARVGLAQLMRQVCDGPWVVVRSIALDQTVIDIDDTVEASDAQCRAGSKTVRYRVRVSTEKGLVANSKEGTVEIPVAAAEAAPAAPGNARVAHRSDGRHFLTWDAVPGATSYRIERVVGAKGAWTLLREVSGTTTSYTDAVSGQPQYRITAVNAAGASAPAVFR